MASAFTHVVVALSAGAAWHPPGRAWRVALLASVCAVFPDIDSIGFLLGVPYQHPWGHRGMTHSLLFATVLAAVVTTLALRDARPRMLASWLLLTLVTASHGLLDAMTDGGLGIAFFAPFDNQRYFLPWRPIRTSPIHPGLFFVGRGWDIIVNEARWVWGPVVVSGLGLAAARLGYRRWAAARSS